jgi:glycine betaine/proline transport system ATP-binding protein
MSLVKVEHLTKVFGSDPESALPLVSEGRSRDYIRKETGQTVGIAEVNFEVHRGEILVIMGLSGSGKSTLVRCVNRLIEPTAGKVYLDGADVTAMDQEELRETRRRRMAMVFQRFALFPHRTVLQNAAYGLEVMGESLEERNEKAQKALDLVGLKGWEDRYPDALSGGMQQRVGLARALAVDAEIILMDEALSALDPLIRKDMQNELVDLQRNLGKTILFITHDLDEAINIGDRIILMKDGRIVQTGTAEDILVAPASDYVARFTEEIDRSKVLTAKSIMRPVHNVVHKGNGPRTTLRKMKESGVSTLFVVDAHNTLYGIVRAEDAAEFLRARPEQSDRKTSEDFQQVFDTNVRSVRQDIPIAEIIPMMAASRDPVAVVDDKEKLRGVIVIGVLLAGLAEGAEPEGPAEPESPANLAPEEGTKAGEGASQ